MLVDDHSRKIIQPELIGEQLLWAGRPDPSVTLVAWPSITMFSFGVAWTALCFPLLMNLFGSQTGIQHSEFIPLAFGLALLSSPIWYYIDAKRTAYGITDKRVIIVVNRSSRDVESFDASVIGGIKVRERGGGTGDIRFAWRSCSDNAVEERWQEVKLVGIPNVREVEKLLRDTFNEPE